MAHTFPKYNKLCGKLRIAQVYAEGQRFVAWPLRVTWMSAEAPTQILVWAPKSSFKKATQRNRIRRLMREAYRLQQELLGTRNYHIAFNYMDTKEPTYALVEKAMHKALVKIAKNELENSHT